MCWSKSRVRPYATTSSISPLRKKILESLFLVCYGSTEDVGDEVYLEEYSCFIKFINETKAVIIVAQYTDYQYYDFRIWDKAAFVHYWKVSCQKSLWNFTFHWIFLLDRFIYEENWRLWSNSRFSERSWCALQRLRFLRQNYSRDETCIWVWSAGGLWRRQYELVLARLLLREITQILFEGWYVGKNKKRFIV